MAQLWGVLGLILSESPILPLNVTRYQKALLDGVNGLRPANISLLGNLITDHSLHMDMKMFVTSRSVEKCYH